MSSMVANCLEKMCLTLEGIIEHYSGSNVIDLHVMKSFTFPFPYIKFLLQGQTSFLKAFRLWPRLFFHVWLMCSSVYDSEFSEASKV